MIDQVQVAAPSPATEPIRTLDGGGDRGWPLVTIAVICYNHARFVARCLDSIAALHYSNVEVLILDDASSDCSIGIIEGWLEGHPEWRSRSRLIRNSSNQRLMRNLNRAIAEARGEFFLWTSADDDYLPSGVSALVGELIRNPHLLAAFGDCHVVDSDGRQIHESCIEGLYVSRGMRKRDLRVPALRLGAIVFQWAGAGAILAFRREAFAVVGGYAEDLHCIEDYYMYTRLAATGRLGFVDEYVSNYRMHGSNTLKTLAEQVGPDIHLSAALNRGRLRGAPALRLWALSQYRRFDNASTRGKWMDRFLRRVQRLALAWFQLYRWRVHSRWNFLQPAELRAVRPRPEPNQPR